MEERLHKQSWLPHAATVACLLSYTLLAVFAPLLHDCSRHAHGPRCASTVRSSEENLVPGLCVGTEATEALPQVVDASRSQPCTTDFQSVASIDGLEVRRTVMCAGRGELPNDATIEVRAAYGLEAEPLVLAFPGRAWERVGGSPCLLVQSHSQHCSICEFLNQAQSPFASAPPKLVVPLTLWDRGLAESCVPRELIERVRARAPPV